MEVLLGALLALAIALLVLGRLFTRVTIYDHERGLRYRNGKLAGLVQPGAHWVYRPTTMIQRVDVRETFGPMPAQEVVTSDGASIKVSLIVQYRVADPVKALTQVDDYWSAAYSIIQVSLREVVSALPIDDVLARREEIGAEVLGRVAERISALGLEVKKVDLRDLMFPGPMKRVFAQVVEARQQGLAALERARGETAALRNLSNAARLVESNPALFQLRLLQKLESTPGNTVILGMPASSTPLPIRGEQADGPRGLVPGNIAEEKGGE